MTRMRGDDRQPRATFSYVRDGWVTQAVGDLSAKAANIVALERRSRVGGLFFSAAQTRAAWPR